MSGKKPREVTTPLRGTIMRRNFQGYVMDALKEYIERVEGNRGISVWNEVDVFDRLHEFGEFLKTYEGTPLHHSREYSEEAAEADDAAIAFAYGHFMDDGEDETPSPSSLKH